MARTAVGDRYVLEEMRRLGANLGGEQSGHVIFLDHARTGDGLLTALQLLRAVREAGQRLSELAAQVEKLPQVLLNVRVRSRPPLGELRGVAEALARWEAKLDGRARILLRYSGTEPLARVMVEGDDQATIATAAREIAPPFTKRSERHRDPTTHLGSGRNPRAERTVASRLRRRQRNGLDEERAALRVQRSAERRPDRPVAKSSRPGVPRQPPPGPTR